MLMSFADDLRRFGPESPERVSLDQAKQYCAQLTASHYENFSVVTWLTPARLRPHFASIYGFCRWSDDLGDEVGDRDRSRALLLWWRGELDAMFAGAPRHPVMMALAETVRAFEIPIDPFRALISAFEQDQDVLNYETYDQLLDYCTRSADPVGHLVLYLGRCFDPENAKLSNFTCTGLQLANFWQDVARDDDIGRIYLPREDRDRFGVSEEDLHQKRFTPQFAALLEFEVKRSRESLMTGWPLVKRIPHELAVDVDLFTRGGLAILDRIVACRYDVLSARPKLTKRTKLALLMRAVWGMKRPMGSGSLPKSAIAIKEGA